MDMNIVGAYAIVLFVVGFLGWFMWNYGGFRGIYIRTFKKNKLRAAYHYMEAHPAIYHMDGAPKLKFYQTHPLFNQLKIHDLIELEKIYEKTKGGIDYGKTEQGYGISTDPRLQEFHTSEGVSRGTEEGKSEENRGKNVCTRTTETRREITAPDDRRGYAEDAGRAEGAYSAPKPSSVQAGTIEEYEQHQQTVENAEQESERKQKYFS